MKVVFVISKDFGELSNSVSFLLGQRFASVLLIPESHRESAGKLPAPTFGYRNGEDILHHFESERPDVVLFFSGYLLVSNRLLMLDEFAEVVLAARRYAVVATSDPFLGLLAARSPRNDIPRPFQAEPDHETRDYELVAHVLAGIPHLYNVLPPDTAPPRSLAHYNPALHEHTNLPLPESVGRDRSRPSWLFVLSQIEYGIGCETHSTDGFHALLTQRLRDTLDVGRQPVVIAPAECLQRLAERSELPADVLVFPRCPLTTFLPLQLEAEVVFYWNVWSHSIVNRLMRGRPFVSFGRGHLSRGRVAPAYATAVRTYTEGIEPPLLPFDQPLTVESVARHWEQCQPAADALRRGLRRGLPTEEILDRLMRARNDR